MRTDTFRIHTGNRPAVIDLSDRCARFVADEAGGLLTVFVPHATAGVAILETGAGSDIDLIIVFAGTSRQKRDLCLWLDAWSVCLAQLGLELYGFPGEGLLDVRFVDADRADVEIKSFVAGGSTIRALPLGDGTMKAGDA